jgi:hypothetical protein
MSVQPALSSIAPPPASPGRFVRVEYQGFRNVAEHREYRLRVTGPGGSTEQLFRIAIAAFGAGRVRLQDGPDVCYQKLLRSVALGEPASPDVTTIDDLELASYREAHTPVKKRRPRPASSEPLPAFVPRPPARTPIPRLPVAPVVVSDGEPALQQGQRVSHSVFGVGVTTASDHGHTVVSFDKDGARTFVTRLVKLDVLSAPHTWETSPRGANRLRRTTTGSGGAGSAT